MFRRVLVGLMLLFAFTIMFVLVTPDPTDDVTAVVRPSILHKAYPRTEPLQKLDRKSTRLNSSHGYISYAVFCLKKKKQQRRPHQRRQTVHDLATVLDAS